MSENMVTALRNLADGKEKHGAHVLPGLGSHGRITPLRALKDRGLIAQIRDPFRRGESKRVHWIITDAGRAVVNGQH